LPLVCDREKTGVDGIYGIDRIDKGVDSIGSSTSLSTFGVLFTGNPVNIDIILADIIEVEFRKLYVVVRKKF
jgi:hypothetical protein